MRHRFTGIIRTSALALLSVAFPLLTVHAQTAPAQTVIAQNRPAGPFSYDASQEVALNGTVSSVLVKASPGMIPGSHLLLMTVDGAVDISLGTASLKGTGVLPLPAGQQAEVVGVMKTIKAKQVFLARSVKLGSHLYTIRNQHGIPVSQAARERKIQTAVPDGDTL